MWCFRRVFQRMSNHLKWNINLLIFTTAEVKNKIACLGAYLLQRYIFSCYWNAFIAICNRPYCFWLVKWISVWLLVLTFNINFTSFLLAWRCIFNLQTYVHHNFSKRTAYSKIFNILNYLFRNFWKLFCKSYFQIVGQTFLFDVFLE